MQPRRRIRSKRPAEALTTSPAAWSELVTASSMGLTVVAYQRLKKLGCPPLFLEIMMCLHATPYRHGSCKLIMVEMFCGVAAISRAFSAAGFPSMGYDFLKDPLMNNILSPAGFLHAIAMVASLDPVGGFLWQATVCSTWVWISQGSTGRSAQFPLGVPCRSTLEANCMVARCSLLVLLSIARGTIWALEQPSSSLMTLHPAMTWVRSFHGKMVNADWYECETFMGAFDGATLKPTTICGNRRLVHALGRSRQGIRGNSATVYTVKANQTTGEKYTQGGPGLKATQAYTDTFGAAVLDAYIAMGYGEPTPDAEAGPDGTYSYPEGVWDLADLPVVLQAARR